MAAAGTADPAAAATSVPIWFACVLFLLEFCVSLQKLVALFFPSLVSVLVVSGQKVKLCFLSPRNHAANNLQCCSASCVRLAPCNHAAINLQCQCGRCSAHLLQPPQQINAVAQKTNSKLNSFKIKTKLAQMLLLLLLLLLRSFNPLLLALYKQW